MDEIWSFVHTKEARVKPTDPGEWGDCYTWVALDPHCKLVISYLTGKRDGECAKLFMRDLRTRILTRAQITSDGLVAYVDAVYEAFGRHGVDYGQVVKNYRGGDRREDRRYEVGKEQDFITKTRIFGKPREEAMSTSLVERQNLTMRMHMRRLTRMTNAHSKKREPLAAAVALHFMWYNFCRMHETLRVTPAMESGLADHVWTVEELVVAAMAEPAPVVAPSPVPPPPGGGPLGEQLDLFGSAPTPTPTRPALRLIKGGKASAVEVEEDDAAPDTVRGMDWSLLEGAMAEAALVERGAPVVKAKGGVTRMLRIIGADGKPTGKLATHGEVLAGVAKVGAWRYSGDETAYARAMVDRFRTQ